jgi:hypothetical protein
VGLVLRELSVTGQRYQAVLAVIEDGLGKVFTGRYASRAPSMVSGRSYARGLPGLIRKLAGAIPMDSRLRKPKALGLMRFSAALPVRGWVTELTAMLDPDDAVTVIAAGYCEFAAREAHGVSPAYERLANAVSRDGEILELLAGLDPAKRQPNEAVRALPGHWISVEAPGVLPFSDLPAPPDGALYNVLALDGKPLAWTRGHGQALAWFGS